ncbi:proline--tRNA ligase [Candidatus Microgenomates bacterium]|nr:proline--tRNA ligase [Candidatus Microgenomates bacterium]
MKYSQLFGRTIRDEPAEARLASHKLLVKGGFIRRISTGRWSYLPLGMRVWEKIYKIIDDEMKAIDCQKLVVPTLQPIEIWQKTARDKAFGEEMLVVDDHHGATFAIGATAEGVMVELVKMFSPSYKDLPLEVYQFSNKFRDDKRPRGGIMRVREFMMKDAYNFCADEKQFMKSYQKFYDSYLKIAKKLDLKVIPALADSGAIGGSLSHEFHVQSKDGDQTFFVCDQCGHAVNLEKAEFVKEDRNSQEKEKPLKEVEAKRSTTMGDGVKLHGLPLWQQIKDVMYVDENDRFILAIIRGDYNVNETKLRNLTKTHNLRHANNDEIRNQLKSEPGFISPVGIKKNLSSKIKLTIIADESLKSVKNAYGGANKKFRDLLNMNFGRDYQPDIVGDIADAQNGSICQACKKGKLRLKKGFEWGHCFKIDHFYTKPQEGYFTDQAGQKKLLWMGSYGIGMGRSMASIVETHHDEKGIIWPKSVAPYQVYLLAVDSSGRKRANEIYTELLKAGIEVLWDDREDVSAGVKFADVDLIGIPVRLVISQKTGEKIEWKERTEKQTTLLTLDQVLKRLV